MPVGQNSIRSKSTADNPGFLLLQTRNVMINLFVASHEDLELFLSYGCVAFSCILHIKLSVTTRLILNFRFTNFIYRFRFCSAFLTVTIQLTNYYSTNYRKPIQNSAVSLHFCRKFTLSGLLWVMDAKLLKLKKAKNQQLCRINLDYLKIKTTY